MSSTFLGLNTAYTGIQAAQAAINTSAHNISNINTPGYSRQEASIKADRAMITNTTYGTMGTGVVVNSIDRIRDEYYDIKYRNNKSNVGQYEVYENYMKLIEDYFNEFTLEGMTSEYDNFFDAVTELYKNPNDLTCKNNVINMGASLADYFNNLYINVQNIQKDVNEELKNQCERINTISQNIAELNQQINTIEVNSGNANDLRDQRAAMIDELSSMVNVSTSEQQLGYGITYFTVEVNGQALVNNYNYNTIITEPKGYTRNASDSQGMYELTWSNGVTFNEYSTTLRGSVKALIDIRDGCNNAYEVENTLGYDEEGYPIKELNINTDMSLNTPYKGIPYYMSKINEFCKLITENVNSVFVQNATDEDGNLVLDEDGNPINLASNAKGEAGIDFFTIKYTGGPLSALNIRVNEKLIENNDLLATTIKTKIDDGYYVKGESDASLVKELIDIRNSKIYNGGTGSFFLESIVAAVSIDSSKATDFLVNYENISNSIQNQRLSVMGVDADEEAISILKFQQAYNLSAQVMNVLTEIYDKLIQQTGV